MDLTGYFGILRRWWWTLLVATWVAAISGYLIADRIPRTYQSETRVLVGPINTDLDTQRAAGQLAQTYAQLVTSQVIVGSVKQELGLQDSVADLQEAITAVPNDVTRFIDIRVENGVPATAQKIAQQLATELSNLAQGTQGIVGQEGQITVIDAADLPTTAIAPQVSLITLLAAAAGLLGAVVLVALIEYTRNAVRSPEELAALAGVPTLGSVQTSARGAAGTLPATAAASRAATDYRLLTAKLDLARGDNPDRTLLVQGSTPGDGAGLVAANIAVMLAIRGLRVAFVDANSERAEASATLGLSNEPGLGEAITGGDVVSYSVEPISNIVMTVVPRGRQTGEVAQVEQVRNIVGRLLGRAEVVVVAAPPSDRSPGALLWAKAVDAVLLVVPKDIAKKPEVTAAVDGLSLVGANLIGTVLAASPGRRIAPANPPLAIRQAISQEPRREILTRPSPAVAAAGSMPAPPPPDLSGPPTNDVRDISPEYAANPDDRPVRRRPTRRRTTNGN